MRSSKIFKEKGAESGHRYGKLILTGRTCVKAAHGQLRKFVEADCDCGGVGWFLLYLLKNGDTKSCGCLRGESARKRMTTHGLKSHPLYDVYYAMLGRCYNEKDKGYVNYGGRGIHVCERWQSGFLYFYRWAIKNGWEEGKSLDRKDNDDDYRPGNCHFTTREVQSRNHRRNKMITAWGETKCLFDWGKDSRCKIGVWGLRSRFDSGEWESMEEMISAPKVEKRESQRNMKSNTMLTAFGETKCMSAWLEDERCLVKKESLMERLKKNMSHEDAISKAPTRGPQHKAGYLVSPAISES